MTMFRKPFNKSAGKQEERLLPYLFSEHLKTLDPEIRDEVIHSGIWIAGQVYRPKGLKNRNKRVYYAAIPKDDKTWQINAYSYSVKEKVLRSQYFTSVESMESAIRKIMTLEAIVNLGSPVPGLEGNYREVVRQSSSLYFDDKGDLVSAKNGVDAERDAFLTKEKLDKIYGKSEEKAEAAIETWDDFYREIVRKKRLPAGKRASGKLRELISDFNQKLGIEKISKISTTAELQEAVGNIKGAVLADVASKPDYAVYYHYNVMILTALMRTGGNVYDKFSTSASASPETLQLLSDIGKSIDSFAQKGLALSPEQSKQLANLIMQGPDPHADKPLPLEKLIAEETAAKKAAPKPHSP